VGQLQGSLPQPEVRAAAQLERVQVQQEQEEARQLQEVAGAVEQQQQARRASCALLWPQLPWLPYPLLLFAQPQLPRRQARENVLAPLLPRLLQSSWSAFFSL
jgi:hypothetical protein